MTRVQELISLFIVTLLAMSATAANAATLSVATYSETVLACGGFGSCATQTSTTPNASISQTQTYAGNSAQATAGTSSFPSPSLSVNLSLFDSFTSGVSADGSADAKLNYQFDIMGAPGIVNVSVIASGGGSLSLASGDATVLGPGSTTGDSFAVTSSQGTALYEIGNFSFTQTIGLEAGTVYSVSLEALVAAYADGSAFVDPVFTVNDPNYSIAFSDGIGDSLSTTPLPTTLPLFATSLGLIGLLVWRSRRRVEAGLAAT